MKRLFSVVALATVFTICFSSCNKCGHCHDSTGDGTKVCQKDEGKTLYNAVQQSCTDNGGQWIEN